MSLHRLLLSSRPRLASPIRKRYRIYEREYLGNFPNLTVLSPDGWSGKHQNKNQKCFHSFPDLFFNILIDPIQEARLFLQMLLESFC